MSLVLLFLLSLPLLLMWCGRYDACDTHLETDVCSFVDRFYIVFVVVFFF